MRIFWMLLLLGFLLEPVFLPKTYAVPRLRSWFIPVKASRDLKARDEHGRTELMYAVREESESRVRNLLAHKDIDVNARDPEGRTALMYTVDAFSDTNIGIVQALLEHESIDLNAQNKNNDTVFTLARIWDHDDLVRLLVEHKNFDPNARDNKYGSTALMELATYHRSDMVPILLARSDTDVNLKDASGRTALIRAVLADTDVWFFNKRRLKRYNVTSKSFSDRDRQIQAQEQQYKTATIKALLKHEQIDVNAADESGHTALMVGARHRVAKADIEALLAHENIDVNARDEDGRTALMHAIVNVNDGAIESLLARVELDVNAADKDSQTALMLAARHGYNSYAEALLARNDAGVNAQDKGGDTALIYAVIKGWAKTVRDLLAHENIDVNARGRGGKTALIHAVEKDQQEIIAALLSHDSIDANLTDNNGKTALDFALDRQSNGASSLMALSHATSNAESISRLQGFCMGLLAGKPKIRAL